MDALLLGDNCMLSLGVTSDVATRDCSPDLADVQLQRSRFFRRRLAAFSTAVLGVGTACPLCRRVSSLPSRARSRFVAELDDGRGLAPDVGVGAVQPLGVLVVVVVVVVAMVFAGVALDLRTSVSVLRI